MREAIGRWRRSVLQRRRRRHAGPGHHRRPFRGGAGRLGDRHRRRAIAGAGARTRRYRPCPANRHVSAAHLAIGILWRSGARVRPRPHHGLACLPADRGHARRSAARRAAVPAGGGAGICRTAVLARTGGLNDEQRTITPGAAAAAPGRTKRRQGAVSRGGAIRHET